MSKLISFSIMIFVILRSIPVLSQEMTVDSYNKEIQRIKQEVERIDKCDSVVIFSKWVGYPDDVEYRFCNGILSKITLSAAEEGGSTKRNFYIFDSKLLYSTSFVKDKEDISSKMIDYKKDEYYFLNGKLIKMQLIQWPSDKKRKKIKEIALVGKVQADKREELNKSEKYETNEFQKEMEKYNLIVYLEAKLKEVENVTAKEMNTAIPLYNDYIDKSIQAIDKDCYYKHSYDNYSEYHLHGDSKDIIELEKDNKKDRFYFNRNGHLICWLEIHSEPVYKKTMNLNNNDKNPVEYKKRLIRHYFLNNENIHNFDSESLIQEWDKKEVENRVYEFLTKIKENY